MHLKSRCRLYRGYFFLRFHISSQVRTSYGSCFTPRYTFIQEYFLVETCYIHLKQSTFETKNLFMFNIYSILLQYALVVDGECHYKPGHFPAALPAAWQTLLHIPPCQCQGVLVIILGLQLYMLHALGNTYL